MNHMIERVAHRVARIRRENHQRVYGRTGGKLIFVSEFDRQIARAAVEEMMEPTDHMIERGVAVWMAYDNKPPSFGTVNDEWHVMVETALEDRP